MDRYVCIHGHFYQPPRENPWLEAIELQDSAYPYHDWNERITAECYAPNSAARILDGEERIAKIVNNYARISFNFGPTLLTWMEHASPETYRAILAADQESQPRFSGHGSALAQAYNHMIMPLANRRDKETQVRWGIRDFEHRFGRRPEGMWLPETAVDVETLEILAAQGIRFTILAPHQARRVRSLDASGWHDVGPGGIDPSHAYQMSLPSGRSLSLFFYDGPVSRAVAFEGLLSGGERFAERLMSSFDESQEGSRLVHIATDGETYGHHHHHGDMALAYALEHMESNALAQVTNYGEYLERFPPTHEVEIVENTSWSCAHGVERWRNNCGCNTGGAAGWTQLWRAPLREALDWLRDSLAPLYEDYAGQYLRDPWAARNGYIDVVLDRSPESLDRFLGQHAARELNQSETTNALALLEMQRHAMLMFTSCGWFFDELSGLEPVQVIQYAGRAVQLAEELFGEALESRLSELLEPPFQALRTAPAARDGLEGRFLALLERAPSNLPEYADGRVIYSKFVKTAMVGLHEVAAHYAVRSLFEAYPRRARVYGYAADLEDFQRLDAGRASLGIGRACITSEVTRESADLIFGVLHFGDHNLNGGVREFQGEASYRRIVEEAAEPFERADFPEVIRFLDRHFGSSHYSLRSLFRDEQRRISNLILESVLSEAEAGHRQIYERYTPLMRFLADLGAPLPTAVRASAEFILNLDLRRAFLSSPLDGDRIRALSEQVTALRFNLDGTGLAYTLKRTIEGLAEEFRLQPAVPLLEQLDRAVDVARQLPFEVDLWKAQNAFYDVLQRSYAGYRNRSEGGDVEAHAWIERFTELGEKLHVRMDSTAPV